jgi:hypothetical protein
MPTIFGKEREIPSEKHARKCLGKKKKKTTKRLDLSGHPPEDPNQKTQEISN